MNPLRNQILSVHMLRARRSFHSGGAAFWAAVAAPFVVALFFI